MFAGGRWKKHQFLLLIALYPYSFHTVAQHNAEPPLSQLLWLTVLSCGLLARFLLHTRQSCDSDERKSSKLHPHVSSFFSKIDESCLLVRSQSDSRLCFNHREQSSSGKATPPDVVMDTGTMFGLSSSAMVIPALVNEWQTEQREKVYLRGGKPLLLCWDMLISFW